MKLIKPSFEILTQSEGIEGVKKQIERAARICYKSESKITDTSADAFVDRMIKSKHLATLEQGTVYLTIPFTVNQGISEIAIDIVLFYLENRYSQMTIHKDSTDEHYTAYITTNLRVIEENNRYKDLDYIEEPTEYHCKRITVKFICSRSTSHQIVRHRSMSFCQESQRYCNYLSNKFNNEVTFVYPSWLEEFDEQRALDESPWPDFTYGLLYAEQQYFELLELGLKPQQARQILPNACKTELIVTGFVSDWEALFKLRCEAGADPDIKEIMIPLREEFVNRELL